MKAKFLVAMFCMISTVFAFGQNEKTNLPESTIFAPEFSVKFQKEGHGYLKDYLLSHIVYPENSLQWDEKGTEVIQFLVTPTGEVTDFKIINSISPDIDREVERALLSTSGMWRPSFDNGKPIAREREISLVFAPGELNPTKKFIKEAREYVALGNKQFFFKKNSKNALYYYNRAARYVPTDKSLLVTRGMCKYQLGDKTGACRDWNRIKSLGGMEGDAYLDNFCEYNGYSEMISMVK